MNEKNIAKSIKYKLDDWCKNIDDKFVAEAIKKNAIVTGGALVSLLNGEQPNDYDIYFKTYESCKKVAEYYANKWNENKKNKVKISSKTDGKIERVVCNIGDSKSIVEEEQEDMIDDTSEPKENIGKNGDEIIKEPKPKYRPRYFTENAISLSDSIQIVTRFTGKVEKIHENYDFVHCTCSYEYDTNKVTLPQQALVSIINKELIYNGSKYPLCSIIRTRKFISRGWIINAGQYVKMALQLNELDLQDIEVFNDQLIGVDSGYFTIIIEALETKKTKDKNFKLDNSYLFELINKVF